MRIKLRQKRKKNDKKYHSSFNKPLYFNRGDLKLLLFFEISNIEICKIIENDNLHHIFFAFILISLVLLIDVNKFLIYPITV